MKKRRIIFLVCSFLLMVVLLTGCAKEDAQNAFDQMMQAMKSGDVEQIAAYGGMPDGSGFVEEELADALFQTVLATMEKMEYVVVDAKKEKNGAVVLTVNLTTVDHQTIIQEYIPRVKEMISDPGYRQGISSMDLKAYQRRLVQQMLTVLERDDIPLVGQTTTITMIKENDVWIPSADKERIFDMMYMNLADAVLSLI